MRCKTGFLYESLLLLFYGFKYYSFVFVLGEFYHERYNFINQRSGIIIR